MLTVANSALATLAQTELKRLGHYGGKIDGQWGPVSQAAFDAYQSAAPPTGEPLWLKIARDELGVAEIPGTRHNERIVFYHTACTLKASDDETPWCSSFVNWCLYRAGVSGTRNAMARSFLSWGQSIVTPKPGAIVVFQRGRPPAGHVAFYLSESGGYVTVLGGNQGDRVSIAQYPRVGVLGYRWPA